MKDLAVQLDVYKKTGEMLREQRHPMASPEHP